MLAGRVEVGTIGTDMLTDEVEGPRVLLLGGRSWKVTHVDWERRRCFVEAVDAGGRAKWSGSGGGLSYEITRGMREVLLGASPASVIFTGRATEVLAGFGQRTLTMSLPNMLIVRLPSDSTGRWWTWAGTAANRSLQASLPKIVDPASGSTRICPPPAGHHRSDSSLTALADGRVARPGGRCECTSRTEVLVGAASRPGEAHIERSAWRQGTCARRLRAPSVNREMTSCDS